MESAQKLQCSMLLDAVKKSNFEVVKNIFNNPNESEELYGYMSENALELLRAAIFQFVEAPKQFDSKNKQLPLYDYDSVRMNQRNKQLLQQQASKILDIICCQVEKIFKRDSEKLKEIYYRLLFEYTRDGLLDSLNILKNLYSEIGDVSELINHAFTEYYSLTPLHIAAMNRHLQVAQWLLGNGADVQPVDHIGRSPLHYACDIRSNLILLGPFLNHVSSHNFDKQQSRNLTHEPFQKVGKSDNKLCCELIQLLVENGADCSLEDKTLYIDQYGARSTKNKETVFHLLAKIRFVNYDNPSTTTQKEMEKIIVLLTEYYIVSPELRKEIEDIYNDKRNLPQGYSIIYPCPLTSKLPSEAEVKRHSYQKLQATIREQKAAAFRQSELRAQVAMLQKDIETIQDVLSKQRNVPSGAMNPSGSMFPPQNYHPEFLPPPQAQGKRKADVLVEQTSTRAPSFS